MFAHDGAIRPVKSGDVLQIPKGTKHSLKATTNLELIEVQMGSQLIEEDIVRYCANWDEIEEYCYLYEKN